MNGVNTASNETENVRDNVPVAAPGVDCASRLYVGNSRYVREGHGAQHSAILV